MFHCKRCGKCCKWSGIVKLTPDEVDNIARYLNMSVEDFLNDYCTISRDRQCLSLIERGDGACVFLDDSHEFASCEIEAVKPSQCKNYPEVWNFPGWEKECPGAEN